MILTSVACLSACITDHQYTHKMQFFLTVQLMICCQKRPPFHNDPDICSMSICLYSWPSVHSQIAVLPDSEHYYCFTVGNRQVCPYYGIAKKWSCFYLYAISCQIDMGNRVYIGIFSRATVSRMANFWNINWKRLFWIAVMHRTGTWDTEWNINKHDYMPLYHIQQKEKNKNKELCNRWHFVSENIDGMG